MNFKPVFFLSFFFFSFLSIDAYAKPLEVGIILWRGETEIDQAFVQKLKSHFTDANIKQINVKQNIRETAKTLNITWQHELKDMDYLFAFGSRNSLQIRHLLKEIEFSGTLISFGSAAELKKAHQNRHLTKEKLLLATTIFSPEIFFSTFASLLNLKKIGVPYNLHEPQNLEFLQTLKRAALERQIEIVPIRTKPNVKTLKTQLDRAFERLDDIDALLFPSDSFLLSQAEVLNACSQELNILAIGVNKQYVQAGTSLGLDSNYANLGKLLAEQVIAIEAGTPLLDLPIVQNQTGRIVANRSSLKKRQPQLLKKLPPNTRFIN